MKLVCWANARWSDATCHGFENCPYEDENGLCCNVENKHVVWNSETREFDYILEDEEEKLGTW